MPIAAAAWSALITTVAAGQANGADVNLYDGQKITFERVDMLLKAPIRRLWAGLMGLHHALGGCVYTNGLGDRPGHWEPCSRSVALLAMTITTALGASVAPRSQTTALLDSSFAQWFAQGESLANEGAYDLALRCFAEAAILNPSDRETLVYQAVCLIHLGQPQRALAVADQVLAIAPHHPQGWLYRGVALHRLGRYKESYSCYARVQPS